MTQKQPPGANAPETKTRIPVWIYPSTLEVLDRAVPKDNCKSRSELIERAVLFYAGYLSGGDACDFLPPALVAALRGTLQDSEGRTARLLFKLAVEISMMMNVLAAGLEISEEDLKKLRARCVGDVKKSNGSISLTDAVRFQKGL